MPKVRVTKTQLDFICDELIEGRSLRKICDESNTLPSYRTVCRHVRDDSEAYDKYRAARNIQCELLRDDILELVSSPLPDDPKMAMAEVQRRRLEADQKDKYIRQLQPLGLRDKAEDAAATGSITLTWLSGEVETTTK